MATSQSRFVYSPIIPYITARKVLFWSRFAFGGFGVVPHFSFVDFPSFIFFHFSLCWANVSVFSHLDTSICGDGRKFPLRNYRCATINRSRCDARFPRTVEHDVTGPHACWIRKTNSAAGFMMLYKKGKVDNERVNCSPSSVWLVDRVRLRLTTHGKYRPLGNMFLKHSRSKVNSDQMIFSKRTSNSSKVPNNSTFKYSKMIPTILQDDTHLDKRV